MERDEMELQDLLVRFNNEAEKTVKLVQALRERVNINWFLFKNPIFLLGPEQMLGNCPEDFFTLSLAIKLY
jgi:hypothetical protein